MINTLTKTTLWMMALQFNLRPDLRPYLKGKDGWINFSVGFKSKRIEQSIVFRDGRVRVRGVIPEDTDVTLIFRDERAIREMAVSTPNEMLNLILKNRMVLDGNLACLQIFNFFISLLMGRIHGKMQARFRRLETNRRKQVFDQCRPDLSASLHNRARVRMKGPAATDPGVLFLADPYLPELGIENFPRLKTFFDFHFDTRPEICPERPALMTQWFRENGFEKKKDNTPWAPELRQALAFKHLMELKKPVIRSNDLLAGTTSSKDVGVTVFPDGQGTMIWGELHSMGDRSLIPFTCTRETVRTLHHDVLPYWTGRSFREYVRRNFNYPDCQKLDERFVPYFVWKSVGISHTIPNFKRILERGSSGIISDIRGRYATPDLTPDQKTALEAMETALGGLETFAANLAETASAQAGQETDPKRKSELESLCRTCKTVPAQPARTLDEAVNAVWISWIGLHMENSNTGLSLGRLDQLFQPYFIKDMEKQASEEEKQAYIRHAVELAGCLIMRLTDHVPLLPDIANYLFGGAASTQAITLGGVTPGGGDGVNDMTYIFLKAVEMLPVRDTNINARYHREKNSDAYLKRLCEVNIITSATPIMQSDTAVAKSLEPRGYATEDINDWAATGCVEPSLQGQHFGHTGSILMNLVAALEMALNNGYHPLMKWKAGPETGDIINGDFRTFEDFYTAWAVQQQFLINQAVQLNNYLGEAHQQMRPAPLLSALMDGCIDKAKDVVNGGAKYNSSGTSNIGLADVADSLLVIKKLVFDEEKISFTRLKQAIDTDFNDDPALRAMVRNQVPRFGSGDAEALGMGQRVARTVHGCYQGHTNYRGGHYTTGFWSMSQHVAYGSLSGTLPSGRLAGKAFTPGLTPSPGASDNFLDNILTVADLAPEYMDNNIAFNVKLSPGSHKKRQETVDAMYAYVKAYFDRGGMQMQFNVVTSETLKDAMANPEAYKNLMVRISGYNAYFVSLNKEIQMELIERAEYGL